MIEIDFSEKGRDQQGEPCSLDQRLFVQLYAFGACKDTQALIQTLEETQTPGVLYADINDPNGVALLTFSDQPDYFISHLRPILNQAPFNQLQAKPEFTMLGRTYTLGYEKDMEYVLLKRPIERALNPELNWVIWYPLRRHGAFETLEDGTQKHILKEHGELGMAFSQAGYGVDIRLACHGLDKNDNDFVIGLLGKELAPLSSLVQRMRKTQQTSRYLEQLGPFFIGKVIWQSKP